MLVFMALPFAGSHFGSVSGFTLLLRGLAASAIFFVVIIVALTACLIKGGRGRLSTLVTSYLFVPSLIYLGAIIIHDEVIPDIGFWLDVGLAMILIALCRSVRAMGCAAKRESSQG